MCKTRLTRISLIIEHLINCYMVFLPPTFLLTYDIYALALVFTIMLGISRIHPHLLTLESMTNIMLRTTCSITLLTLIHPLYDIHHINHLRDPFKPRESKREEITALPN